jgi:hypothetical protein
MVCCSLSNSLIESVFYFSFVGFVSLAFSRGKCSIFLEEDTIRKKEIASANSAITRPDRRPIGELVEKTEKWEKEEVFIGQGHKKKIEKRKKKKNSRHKNNKYNTQFHII